MCALHGTRNHGWHTTGTRLLRVSAVGLGGARPLCTAGVQCSFVRINGQTAKRHGRQRRCAQLSGVPHADNPQVQRVRRVRLLLHGLRAERSKGVLCARRVRRAHEVHARAREPRRVGGPLHDAPAHADRLAQPQKGQDRGRADVPTHVGDPLPRSQALHAPPDRRLAFVPLREDRVWHVGRAHGNVRPPQRGLPAPQLPSGAAESGGRTGPRQRGQARACAAPQRIPPAGPLCRGHDVSRALPNCSL